MKVLLMVDSYLGGAGKVAQILGNAWAEEGHEVGLWLLEDPPSSPQSPLHSRVVARELLLSRVTGRTCLDAFLRRLWHLRRAIHAARPDVVVSFISYNNIMVGLALLGSHTPLIVSERSDPAHRPLGRVWELLRCIAYRRAQVIVVQTGRAAAFFRGSLARKTMVIHNPVLPAEALPRVEAPAEGPVVFVAVGRLHRVKGFDLLVEAFAAMHRQYANTRLRIVGEGPERANLEAQVAALGLQQIVMLPGHAHDVSRELANADIFVLSSRVEGFPNALCEAMAAGLPAIAFDCPSGPADIIRHEEDGLLAPPKDVAALAEAMCRLAGDASLRARLGAQARQVATRFSVTQVTAAWLQAIAVARRNAHATTAA